MNVLLTFLKVILAILQIRSVELLTPAETEHFEFLLKYLEQDSHPLNKEVGPVITKAEAEICRKIKFVPLRLKQAKITKYMSYTKLRWRAASECCQLRQRVLMTLGKKEFLQDYLAQVNLGDGGDIHSDNAIWTSASNVINKRLFEWQNGDDFNPKNWAAGEPNNYNDKEGCGQLFYDEYGSGGAIMNDYNCEVQSAFICEDETKDVWYGPNVKPEELSVCSNLETDFENFGGRYYKTKLLARWILAQACCEKHGLHLISLDDETEEEIKELKGKLKETIHLTWTSGNDLPPRDDMDYKWHNDIRLSNLNWNYDKSKSYFENYPQNYHPRRNCLQMRTYNWDDYPRPGLSDNGIRIRDVQCGLLRDFICERPRSPSNPVPPPPPAAGNIPTTTVGTTTTTTTTTPRPPPKCRDPRALVERRKPAFNLKSSEDGGGQYPPGQDCTYTFTAGPGCTLELSCDEIDIRSPCTVDTFSVTDKAGGPKGLCTNPKDDMGTAFNLIAPGSTSLVVGFKSGAAPTFDRLYAGFSCLVKCTEDKVVVTTTTTTTTERATTTTTTTTEKPEYVPPFMYSKALPDKGVPVEEERILPDLENQRCNADYYHPYFPIPQKEFPSEAEYAAACNVPKVPCIPNPVPKEIESDIGFQNRKLLAAYVQRAIAQTCVPDHKPDLGFKLYDLVVTIFMKSCPRVPERFLDNARFLFKVLHYVSSEGRTDLIDQDTDDRVHDILHKCKAGIHVHPGFMNECMEQTLAFDNVTNFVCPKPAHAFNVRQNDPLIDIFWKIYESVHAICFPYFKGERRMYHQFSVAILDLMSTSLKERWETYSGSHDFWEKLLGPSYEITLENIERCTHHSVMSSQLPFRIGRKTLPQNVRLVGETGN